MFLPAFFIYIVQRKKLLETLKSYSFYLSLGIFIFLVGGYYISREIIDPGYLARVLQFEMTGRYFHTLDGHNQHFWYYINTLSNWQFRPWLYFIPLSGFLLLFNKKDNLRRFYSFVLIIILSYLVIISLGQTKLEWYIAPIFPLLALFTSYVLEQLYLSILSIITLKREIMKSLFWILFIFAIFSQPYDSIIDKISQVNDNWDAVKYGTFIKKIKEESPELKEYRIIFDGWNSQILYYKEVLNTIYNYDIEFEITDRNPELLQNIFDDINVGDKIMMNQQNIINDLEKKFEMDILFSYDEIILVDVTSSTSTNRK